MKLSNKTFYKRHDLELEKYIKNRSSIHIVNAQSKNKVVRHSDNIIYLDLNDRNNLEKLVINSKFERIVLTDVVESHEDLYS